MLSVKCVAAGGVLLAALCQFGVAQSNAASASAPSWEGFYLGADVGYGMGVGQVTSSTPLTPGLTFDFISSHGPVGGVLAGYNHMVSPRWILGLEGDIGWPDIAHNDTLTQFGLAILTLQVVQNKPAYSLRARAGYLVTPETMLYGTAGWAWSEFTQTRTALLAGSSETDNSWFNGPQIGAGIETMVAPGWMARLEYLHTFYSTETFGALGLALRPDVAVGRVALIHKFGSTAAAPWDSQLAQPSWNGFYVGGALGGGIGSAKVEFPTFSGSEMDGVGTPGVFPTLLAGYDWRAASRWVLGAEAEVEPGISTADFRLGWTAALRGRLGFLLTPATMLYGTAGWLTSSFETSMLANVITIPGQRLSAAELGGGVETALTDHWAARFEYQFAFASTLDGSLIASAGTVAGFPISGGTAPFTAHLMVQYAKLGLVYMFNGS